MKYIPMSTTEASTIINVLSWWNDGKYKVYKMYEGLKKKKNWEEQENIIFYIVLGRRNDDMRFFYLIQKMIVKGLVT